MKHYYLILFALISINFSQAQIIDIPDANFKDALLHDNVATLLNGIVTDVDANNDGEIQVSEAENVRNLDVRYKQIVSLEGIQYFSNMTAIYCSNNDIINLDFSGNTLLTYIACANNELDSIDVSQNLDLRTLICDGNNLINLDVSNNSQLVHLNCSVNWSLTGLEVTQNPDLNFLNINSTDVSSLDLSNSSSLNELRVVGTGIANLDVTQCLNLVILWCGSNSISNLDITNNPLLETLSCENNQITSLDVSQNPNLNYLSCGSNLISELDVSNNLLLETFYSNSNGLTSIDVTQNPNLTLLNLNANELESIDLFQNINLEQLYLNDNSLSSLYITNNGALEKLQCNNNQLVGLFLKNGSRMYGSTSLSFEGNPDLNYICIDEIELSYIQNFVDDYGLTGCELNTYCSFVPGGTYYIVEGEINFDIDLDGCDIDDSSIPNTKFNIQSGSIVTQTIANYSGNYFIPLVTGSHTLTPIFENSDYFVFAPESISVNFPTETSPYNQDFCITANGTHNDLEIVILPVEEARPGFDTDYKIIYKNKGNTVMSNSLEFSYNENAGLMELVSSTPVADTHVDNVLTWNFTDLMPFETREILVTMNLNSPTDTPPLNGGDDLGFVANIFPIADDELAGDNNFQLKQEVVNSFDPNDKTCLQGETIEPEDVGKYVHYLIRFENTGTASAVNIVVKDEIDMAKYDVSSLIPLDGSHDFVTRIKDDNIVEFIFEDINLPFDDANNDGYVLFKIKTLETLELGDTFSNDAEIYFDYNAPIITNDEMTTVAENLSVGETELQNLINIYPNPASDVINLESRTNLESITVYDVHGRQIFTQLISTNQTQVNVSQLSKGVYFLDIKTADGEQTSKFIKQ